MIAVAVIGSVGVLAGCGGDDDQEDATDGEVVDVTTAGGVETDEVGETVDGAIAGPAVGASWDYQIGGGYEPDDDVDVVVRDRLEQPDADRYSVCYLNGFQTQSSERAWWLERHPDLVLTIDGDVAVDPDWPDELILDPTGRQRRSELVDIVGAWIDQCADDGYDAVEIDNLDSFTRFPDELDEDDAVGYAAALAERGHVAGLAVAQKNTVELLGRLDETGFDFAIVEECAAYDECGAFVDAFDGRVLAVEYDADALAYGCRTWPDVSFILRDHDVAAPGDEGYVRETC